MEEQPCCALARVPRTVQRKEKPRVTDRGRNGQTVILYGRSFPLSLSPAWKLRSRFGAMSVFKKAPVTDAIEQARMEAAADM